MKLEGDYVFNGPRSEVWTLLNDPTLLATCLPGLQSQKKIGENEYEGTLNIRVGPTNGAYSGRLLVSDLVPPSGFTLRVECQGGPGSGKGVGHVVLEEQPDKKTHFMYEGEMQLAGEIASMGQSLIDSAAKSMVRQGLEAIDVALEARMAEKKGEQADFKVPSEGELAPKGSKGRIRDVTKIAEVRMFGYVTIMILVMLGLALVLSKCGGG